MPKVLISDKMSSEAITIFQTRGLEADYKPGLSPEELKTIIGQYDGLAIRSATRVTAEVIEAAERLRVVGRAGIGVDNVDIPAASRRGIIVMNAPFGNTVTTAEHTLALMMSASRHLGSATASTKAGKWEKNRFMGRELCNKTLGIIGVGNIGALVVDRCLGLKMKVLAYDPYLSRERAEDMGVEKVDSLEAFWPRIDVLTVHTPLTPNTRHIVNAQSLAQMKNGVIIVNCARGGIVDEDALYDGLKSGKVFAAGLDVFEVEPAKQHKLFELENVVCSPHLGASTMEAQENVAVQIAEQISDYLLKGTVQNALNIPTVSEKELPTLRPYLLLGEKLGATLGQLTEAGVRRIEVSFEGEVTRLNCKPITNTIVQSILAPMLDTVVNLVNAPIIAKERGIEVDETTRNLAGSFTSLVRVRITTDLRQRVVAGTLFHNQEPRVVLMDDIPIEASPNGNLLFIANRDAPGMIGRIGTMLGDAGVNIAGFHLGREKEGGRAIAFINVDQEISRELMAQILHVDNVLEAKQVRY